MDTLTFALTFASDLLAIAAWPVTALLLGLMFRPLIKQVVQDLLPRLARLSYGKASADFISQDLPEETAEPVAVDDETRREIRDSPLGTVVQSWLDFLWEASDILRGFGVPVESRSAAQVMRGLVDAKLIGQTDYDIVDRLRSIRNRAVHERDSVPTSEGAELYFRTARAMIRAIHRKAEEWRTPD